MKLQPVEFTEGKLLKAEDMLNCQMVNIAVAYRDDQFAQLENVYIRGSNIRLFVLPDMSKGIPCLRRSNVKIATWDAESGHFCEYKILLDEVSVAEEEAASSRSDDRILHSLFQAGLKQNIVLVLWLQLRYILLIVFHCVCIVTF